jgi:hypothetical protein
VRRIGKKLGVRNYAEPMLWPRPKGMHWRTFECLAADAETARRKAMLIWEPHLRALEVKLPFKQVPRYVTWVV